MFQFILISPAILFHFVLHSAVFGQWLITWSLLIEFEQLHNGASCRCCFSNNLSAQIRPHYRYFSQFQFHCCRLLIQLINLYIFKLLNLQFRRDFRFDILLALASSIFYLSPELTHSYSSIIREYILIEFEIMNNFCLYSKIYFLIP